MMRSSILDDPFDVLFIYSAPKCSRSIRKQKRRTRRIIDHALGLPDASGMRLTTVHRLMLFFSLAPLSSLTATRSCFPTRLHANSALTIFSRSLTPNLRSCSARRFSHTFRGLSLYLGLGVSYLFQNQTQASAVYEAPWKIALGSTAWCAAEC